MRIAFKGNLYLDENNKFYGINLGADYTAEHECGLKDLQNAFGVNSVSITPEIFGIEKRKVTIVPENNIVFKDLIVEGIKYTLLLYSPYVSDCFKVTKTKLIQFELNPYRKDELDFYAAWDGRSFGILTPKEKHYNELKELYLALLNKDCAITIYSPKTDNPYDTNPGLTLFIVSKMPEDLKEEIKEKDLDKYRLSECAEKTGIAEILKKAGKHYFALSPVWANEEKTEVKFWLNPMEQRMYNSGYFTVDELLEWIEEKGPIMNKPNVKE